MKTTKLKVFILPYEYINNNELIDTQEYIKETKQHGRILDISKFQYELNNDMFNQDNEHVMFFYVEYDEQGNESKLDEVVDDTVYVFDTKYRKNLLKLY